MDVSGLFRIWLDFFSEIADMNHDGAHILVNPVGVPKIIEDLAACKHPVRISGEKNQKFKFFCCKAVSYTHLLSYDEKGQIIDRWSKEKHEKGILKGAIAGLIFAPVMIAGIAAAVRRKKRP